MRGIGFALSVASAIACLPATGASAQTTIKIDTWLSHKYDGKDPGEDKPGAVRVVVRMTVDKATGYAA